MCGEQGGREREGGGSWTFWYTQPRPPWFSLSKTIGGRFPTDCHVFPAPLPSLILTYPIVSSPTKFIITAIQTVTHFPPWTLPNAPPMNKKALWPVFGSRLSNASVTQSIPALLVHTRAWAFVSVLEEARDCHLVFSSIALLLIF